jgi:hypothetical protein
MGLPVLATGSVRRAVFTRSLKALQACKVLQALTRFKTPEAAEVIASQLHRWVGDDAVEALKQMGTRAEPIGLRPLTHREPAVRVAAANILYNVSSSQSVEALGGSERPREGSASEESPAEHSAGASANVAALGGVGSARRERLVLWCRCGPPTTVAVVLSALYG